MLSAGDTLWLTEPCPPGVISTRINTTFGLGFLAEEEAALGLALGCVAEDVQAPGGTAEPSFSRRPPLQNFRTQTPSHTFSVEFAGREGLCQRLFLTNRAQNVAVRVPKSLECFIGLVCRVHLGLNFLSLGFHCELCNAAHSSCQFLLSPRLVSLFQLTQARPHAEQDEEYKEGVGFATCTWH